MILAEAVLTLTGKRYSLNKVTVCTVVRALVGDNAFVFENNQVVWSALGDFEQAKPIRGIELDFADALIAHKSHKLVAENGVPLAGFYSFDKAVAQLQGAKKP